MAKSLFADLLTGAYKAAQQKYAPTPLPPNPFAAGIGAGLAVGQPSPATGGFVAGPAIGVAPPVRQAAQPAPPPATPPGPSTPFPGYLTPDQIRAQAQALVDAQYGYQQAEYERQRTNAANYAQTVSGALQGFDSALANIYQGVGPAVQQAYRGAAQDDTGSAAGYSTGLRDAISGSANQANQLLASLGASNPVQDVGQQAGDVLYGIGGRIPANNLEQQGAAFASAASLLPGTAVGQGKQDALQTLMQGKLAQDQINQQLAGLAAQKGSSLTSAVNDLTNQQNQLYGQYATIANANARTQATIDAANSRVRPLVVGSAATGWNIVDSMSGKVLATMPGAPGSAAAANKPVVTGSAQTGWVARDASGKVLWTQKGVPAKPAAAPRPLVVGSSATGWNVVDPSSGKTIATMPGAAQKPVVTGSSATGWVARDPSSGSVLWQQSGAPSKPVVIGSPSTGWSLFDPSTGKTVATMAGAKQKPIVTGSAKTGWVARDASGNVVWTQKGAPSIAKTQTPAEGKTALGELASIPRSINWKTGVLSPTMRDALRQYAIKYGAGDPGPIQAVATRAQLDRLQKFLGITPPSAAKSSNPKPSYGQVTQAKRDAADSARDAFFGVQDNIVKVVQNGKVVAKNEPIPQRSYPDALQDLIDHGIPRDVATKALNRYYKPGRRGRPATTSDYLRDKAIVWYVQNGQVIAHRRHIDKTTGRVTYTPVATISPQDPNYKAALARARKSAA